MNTIVIHGSKQELFDRVALHLLRQNQQCRRPHHDYASGTCAYRSLDGKLACGIGGLISDELYDSELDEVRYPPVADHVRAGRLRFPDIDNDKVFLSHLQAIHDQHEPRDWLYQLREFASRHGLQTGAIDQFTNFHKLFYEALEAGNYPGLIVLLEDYHGISDREAGELLERLQPNTKHLESTMRQFGDLGKRYRQLEDQLRAQGEYIAELVAVNQELRANHSPSLSVAFYL